MKKSALMSLGTALTLSLLLLGSSISPVLAQERLDLQELAVEVNKRALTRKEAQQLKRFLETHPGDSRARKTLGRVYETYGFYNLALEEYRFVSSIVKDDLEALLLSANLLNGLNMLNPDEVADQALVYMGNNLSSLVQVGVFLYNLGKDSQADRVFARASQLDRNSPEFSCIQAYTFLSHRKYAQCLAECDKAMRARNLQYLVLLAKGKALWAMNKPQQALDAFKQAQDLQPINVDTNESYFRALVARGRNAEALEPGLLSLAMTVRERHERIQKELTRVIKQTPPVALQKAIAEASRKLAVTAFQAKFHFALGDLFDKLGQPELAMNEYRRGLELNPVFSPAYAHLAKDFAEHQRDYKKALKNYTLAVRLDPENGDLYMHALRCKMIGQNKNDLAMQLKDWWRRNVR